jgi:hypothetical protein
VAVRSTHRYPDTIVHQSTDLAPAHVIEVDHVRVTTVPRTVIDLAAILNRPRLRSVVEHCVVGRLCDLDQITSMLGTLARRGKPGIRRLRSVIDELGTGVETAASMLERRAVTLLEANGLRPVPQFNLPWRDFRDGRVDLAFPHAKLIIELDGRRWHTRVNDFELDRRRDNLAQLAGWKVLRFTWRDLSDDPAKVVAMVRQALMMTLD